MESYKHAFITHNPQAWRKIPKLEDYPNIYTVDLASGEHVHEDEEDDNE